MVDAPREPGTPRTWCKGARGDRYDVATGVEEAPWSRGGHAWPTRTLHAVKNHLSLPVDQPTAQVKGGTRSSGGGLRHPMPGSVGPGNGAWADQVDSAGPEHCVCVGPVRGSRAAADDLAPVVDIGGAAGADQARQCSHPAALPQEGVEVRIADHLIAVVDAQGTGTGRAGKGAQRGHPAVRPQVGRIAGRVERVPSHRARVVDGLRRGAELAGRDWQV